MLSWLKNNWLSLLGIILTIFFGLIAYYSTKNVFIIIIILLLPFVIWCIKDIHKKCRYSKIKKSVLDKLEYPELKIELQRYKRSDIEIMVNIFREIINSDDSLDRQKKAISLLSQLASNVKETITLLHSLLKDKEKNVDIRRAAANALGTIDSNDVIKPLVNALEDPDIRVVEAAAASLREKQWERDVLWALLRVLFKSIKERFSRQLIETICHYCERTPAVETELIEAMKCLVDYGNDPVAMDYALEIIKKAGGQPAAQTLLNLEKRWKVFQDSEIYLKISQTLQAIGQEGLQYGSSKD